MLSFSPCVKDKHPDSVDVRVEYLNTHCRAMRQDSSNKNPTILGDFLFACKMFFFKFFI